MVKDPKVKEARDAHRRKLAAPRRAARSKDPEAVALREHRKTHKYNLLHETAHAVPEPEFKAQRQLEGDGDE